MTVDAICFNTKRQHVLTADGSSLRLWSMRKELKRIALLPQARAASVGGQAGHDRNEKNEKDEKQAQQVALVVSLTYVVGHDVYLAVFGGDPRVKESPT